MADSAADSRIKAMRGSPRLSKSLRVVMVAGEAVPYAKVGGLGDVIGALPPELEKLGVTVSVIIPCHKAIDLRRHGIRKVSEGALRVPLGSEEIPFDVFAAKLPGSAVRVYFIGNDRFFGRDGIYTDPKTGNDYADQADRWIFFQRAALEWIRTQLPDTDIIHCHDHQTALIPAYLRRSYAETLKATSILTIHNMGYQGLFSGETMVRAGFRADEFFGGSPFEFYGKFNFMKTGITHASLVTTVSETYAREIQENDEFSFGLDGVLRALPVRPVGIRNGIDYDAWNPENDPLIPASFSALSPEGKARNKLALLRAFGLDTARAELPLLTMVSRLDVQKGFDLLLEILDDLLSRDLTFVLLGTGARDIQAQLAKLIDRHKSTASAMFKYDNALAHLAEAGADIFLMPSKYEPCGLNQMYSMRYGTVPVVRATGGLADTVKEFDVARGVGTGFSFESYDAISFRDAVHRALKLWPDRRAWKRMMANGMTSDFSWGGSARRYLAVYQGLQ